jgi:hypothetical protein
MRIRLWVVPLVKEKPADDSNRLLVVCRTIGRSMLTPSERARAPDI